MLSIRPITSELKTKHAKFLFVFYLLFFVFGVATLLPISDSHGYFENANRYSYLILSSCFAGAAFIVVMDYTFTTFEERSPSEFKGTAGWYLSLAMLVWVLRGITYFIFTIDFPIIDQSSQEKLFICLEPTFSTLNSAFLMLGIARLDFDLKKKPRIIEFPIFSNKLLFWLIFGLTISSQIIVGIHYWDYWSYWNDEIEEKLQHLTRSNSSAVSSRL